MKEYQKVWQEMKNADCERGDFNFCSNLGRTIFQGGIQPGKLMPGAWVRPYKVHSNDG